MKTVRVAALIVLGLVCFGATTTFTGMIPNAAQLGVRAGLLAVLGTLWLVARRGPLAPFRPIFFAYFAIVAAMTVDWYGLRPITTWLALGFTPLSSAVAKAVEAALVAGTLIFLTLATGQTPASLYLRRGRLAMGLGIGAIGFAAMAVVTFVPGGPFFRPGVLDVAKVLAVAPWVMLFVLTNALMEELLFRGVLLERQTALVGPKLALFSTTLVFALAHLQITYAAHVIFFVAFVFALGLMWGYLMQKSNSIWGSVLFHAGADVAVILPMYQAMMH